MKYEGSEGQRSVSFGTVKYFNEQTGSQISVKVFR